MRPLSALLVGLCLASSLGCSNAHDGRFLVVVTSDIPAPDRLATVRVIAGEDSHDFALAERPLPFSFAVDARPGRPAADPVSFVVYGLDPSGATLVERPVTTTFVPNRTLVINVELLRRCSGLAQCGGQLRCSVGEVCTPDGCVSPTIDSASLREVLEPGAEIGATLSPMDVCAQLADVQCNAQLRCCPALGSASEDDRDAYRTACVESVVASCEANTLPTLLDPRTAFDGARAAAAMEIGSALARQCSLAFADWSGSLERGVLSSLQGTVPAGGECSFADGGGLFSCRDSACLPTGPTTQACSARSCEGEGCYHSRAIQELAVLADFGCADGLYCDDMDDPMGTGATCRQRRPEGAPCLRSAQCASGICQRDIGHCPDGAECESGSQCGRGSCDVGLGACFDGTPCTSDLPCTYRNCARPVGTCAPRTIQNLFCPRA